MNKRERASITIVLQPMDDADEQTSRYFHTLIMPDTCYRSGDIARGELLERIDKSIVEYERQRDRK